MKNIVKQLNRLMAFVLGVLGFSSLMGCGAYGCPSADFDISGRVVNESDEPIEGIEVQILDTWSNSSAITNTDGEYAIKTSGYPRNTISVVATDIDGEQNGLYDSYLVTVNANYKKRGRSEWYKGKHTGVVNFKLHAAEPTEPEEPENPEE